MRLDFTWFELLLQGVRRSHVKQLYDRVFWPAACDVLHHHLRYVRTGSWHWMRRLAHLLNIYRPNTQWSVRWGQELEYVDVMATMVHLIYRIERGGDVMDGPWPPDDKALPLLMGETEACMSCDPGDTETCTSLEADICILTRYGQEKQ